MCNKFNFPSHHVSIIDDHWTLRLACPCSNGQSNLVLVGPILARQETEGQDGLCSGRKPDCVGVLKV